MIPTGDSISNKFSLKVLEATPYAYIMELRILDVGLPHVITKEEGAQKVLRCNWLGKESQTASDDVEKIRRMESYQRR